MLARRVFQRAVQSASKRSASTALFSVQRAAFSKVAGPYKTKYDVLEEPPYEDVNRHRSDAELRIAQVPVVEVEGTEATCDGGGGALGHPLEFIQLNTTNPEEPQTCKYCGVRFVMKKGYKPHHH